MSNPGFQANVDNFRHCSKGFKHTFFFFSFFLFFFFVFCPFRAALTAYGGSQARGLIEAVAQAYTRATAMPDLSHVCDVHHSSQQCRILNPSSKARDQTCNLMVPSWICFCGATSGTPCLILNEHFLLPTGPGPSCGLEAPG